MQKIAGFWLLVAGFWLGRLESIFLRNRKTLAFTSNQKQVTSYQLPLKQVKFRFRSPVFEPTEVRQAHF